VVSVEKLGWRRRRGRKERGKGKKKKTAWDGEIKKGQSLDSWRNGYLRRLRPEAGERRTGRTNEEGRGKKEKSLSTTQRGKKIFVAKKGARSPHSSAENDVEYTTSKGHDCTQKGTRMSGEITIRSGKAPSRAPSTKRREKEPAAVVKKNRKKHQCVSDRQSCNREGACSSCTFGKKPISRWPSKKREDPTPS